MEINIEERATQARKLFESGYNCAQAVAMAYADCANLPAETMEKVSIAFGGGLGRQREVCGTVSGASMILGIVEANKNLDAKTITYKKVQKFSEMFRQENGSIICRELLNLAKGENSNPEPTPRTEQYYKRRPCADYVEISARLVGQILNQNE